MHFQHSRSALALVLSLSLAACGSDEPEAETAAPAAPAAAVKPAVSTASTAPVVVEDKAPAPVLPVADSPYERGQRSLTEVPSMRLESEFAAAGGSTQYLAGGRQGDKYVFTVRTLPKPDNAFDGSWMFQNGRFLRQQGQGFDQASLPPQVVSMFLNALAALPDEEAELSPDKGALDNANGVSCQPRSIDLKRSRLGAQSFNRLVACVDEPRALIVKISATTRTGETLVATLSGYGEAVEIPQTAEVKSWDQMYPRKQ